MNYSSTMKMIKKNKIKLCFKNMCLLSLDWNQIKAWHILWQTYGKISNIIQKCHTSAFKAENQDKFKWFSFVLQNI